MTWVISEEPRLRGYAVEWQDDDALWLSRRQSVYRLTEGGSPQLVGTIPVPWWEAAASRFRFGQRLLRAMVYNAVPLADGALFLTYGKRIGLLRDGKFVALAGFERPCRVLRGGVAVDCDSSLYFGEYLTNRERTAMRVYRYRPGTARLDVVHTFAAGEIRHVHGIYRDPFDDSLWCLTGDFGDECRILRTRHGFRSIEKVGGGDESWRCVSLLFTREHVYYATDAEFERNRLYRLERSSGRREMLGELDGPTYYTHACGQDLFFGVTAELCPSQVGRAAALWHSSADGTLERLVSFDKDRWPVALFLPGTLHFPGGSGPDEFYFHALGLRGADDRTFRVRRVR